METREANDQMFDEIKSNSFWRQKIDVVLEKLNSLEEKGVLIGRRQDRIDSLAYNYLSRHLSIKQLQHCIVIEVQNLLFKCFICGGTYVTV